MKTFQSNQRYSYFLVLYKFTKITELPQETVVLLRQKPRIRAEALITILRDSFNDANSIRPLVFALKGLLKVWISL